MHGLRRNFNHLLHGPDLHVDIHPDGLAHLYDNPGLLVRPEAGLLSCYVVSSHAQKRNRVVPARAADRLGADAGCRVGGGYRDACHHRSRLVDGCSRNGSPVTLGPKLPPTDAQRYRQYKNAPTGRIRHLRFSSVGTARPTTWRRT